MKILSIIMAVCISAIAFAGKEHTIDTKKSVVKWEGFKKSGAHSGTIAIKSGSVELDGNMIKGGNVVIDMSTITTTDMQGEWAKKLDGHLGAPDFFDINKFPTASIKVKSAKHTEGGNHTVTGELTIKDQTHEVTFTAKVEGHDIHVDLDIMQMLFGITYSGKEDDPIKDGFKVTAHLSLK